MNLVSDHFPCCFLSLPCKDVIDCRLNPSAEICGVMLFYDCILSKGLGKFKICNGFVILVCDLTQPGEPAFAYALYLFNTLSVFIGQLTKVLGTKPRFMSNDQLHYVMYILEDSLLLHMKNCLSSQNANFRMWSVQVFSLDPLVDDRKATP